MSCGCQQARAVTSPSLVRHSVDMATQVDKFHIQYIAAFNTVDHKVFLHKLYNEFAIEDEALNWFRSYLDNRKHRVSINGISSDSHKLK